MPKHDTFNIDIIECDWLTVGSFDQRNKRRWETVLGSEFELVKLDMKQQMYVGVMYSGGFIGQAEQKGQVHTLCRVTGGNAHKIIYRLIRSCAGRFRFTRIDIQLTIVLPEFHSARSLADYLKQNQASQVRLIENNGMDTVYVGSRQSAKMWRIYVKEDGDGNRYLRFEIEVKNGKDNLADRLAAHISKSGYAAMVGYFFQTVERLNLPPEYQRIIDTYRLGETSILPKEIRDSGGKTWRWLDGVVKNSIIKYAQESHGRGEYVIAWLIDIIDLIAKGMKDECDGDKVNRGIEGHIDK